jgi:CubicO group peptidase (beta-lactamase class C family)
MSLNWRKARANYPYNSTTPLPRVSDGQFEDLVRHLASTSAVDWSRAIAFLSGGGGLVSTAADYERFSQALLNGGDLSSTGLLGRKTVELMTANHWTGDKSPYPPRFPIL